MTRLLNKVAIITGAAQGIGLATARKFAAEGAKVVLVDMNQDSLHAAQATLTDAGFTSEVAVVNVTERAGHNAVKRNVRVGGTEGHGGQHRCLGVGLHPLHVLHDLRLHGAVDCGNAHF